MKRGDDSDRAARADPPQSRQRRTWNGLRFAGCDLWRAEFSEGDLRKADFTGAVLDGANFDRADLQNAVFNESGLFKSKARGAGFVGSSLRNADLRGAALEGADFSQADLSGADLKFACLTGARLAGATVKNADFRFSRGLTLSGKTELRRRGARVSGGGMIRSKLTPLAGTIQGKLLGAFLGVAAAFGLFLFFSGNHFQSIPRLVERRDAANNQKHHAKAIRLDFVLSRKFKIRENLDSVVNPILDAARNERSLGRRSRALRLMTDLLKTVGADELQVTKIHLDLAIFFKEEGREDECRKLWKEIRPDILMDNFFASMKLASLDRELKAFPEAESIYRLMLEKFGDDPGRRAEASAALDALMKEREREDSRQHPDPGGTSRDPRVEG